MTYTENDGEPKPTDSQARPSREYTHSSSATLEGRARESASQENTPPSPTTLEGRARESVSEENPSPSSTTLEGRPCESATETRPSRRSLPHHPAVSRTNQSIIIFVTVCTKRRRSLLANQDIHELIVNAWQESDSWLVGRYVLMPDHLHLFCSPARIPESPLRDWVFRWRATVTRHWPRPEEKPIWQKDFFDRQLRKGQSYSEKWEYVRNNPLRAELVEGTDDWSYQGELNKLTWHDASS